MGITLAEFQCSHRASEDETWADQMADLRILVRDDNLVMFEYIKDSAVIGSWRLCWQGFMEFVHNFRHWFLEDDPSNGMTASCVDKSQSLRCMVHSDLMVSFTIGTDKPEIAFCANRGDALVMFDLAARYVSKLPEAGCFRMAGIMEKMSRSPEETLANMDISGHTAH